MSRLSILHLEDDEIDAEYMATMLREEGIECEVHRAIDRDEYLGLLDRHHFDLIVSDFSMPSFDGGQALKLARERAPDTPFIFVSGTIGEEAAVESLKNGAVDYVLKDRLSRFPAAVRRAIEEARQMAERAIFQRELLRRDELFKQITENVDDLIAVLDLNGCRVFSSPSYSRLLGEPSILEGSDSFADVHPEDRNRIRQVFERTVSTGLGQRAEYRMQARDGTVRHIESQGSVIRDANGRVINVVVVSRDVTESRQTEARLREQAELLAQAQDAIFVCNLDQEVTFWNRGAEHLYGWTSQEITGQTPANLLQGAGAPRSDNSWSVVLARGEWTGEVQQGTKAGRQVIVISRRTLLRNQAGEPVAVMTINSDITERKELEEKLLRSQRLEAIGSLAGGIAHDLNNILSPILMLADIMRDESGSGSERDMLQTIKASAMRGADLVRQILSFAHGTSSGSIVLQLRHLIKDMFKLMGDTFPRSIQLESNLASDLWTVRGDPTQLHQVVLNLCVNARDAMPHGGKLTVTAHNLDANGGTSDGRRIVIEVSDTGCGIPAEIREKIFQPFFSTKGPDKGTGLGLSTVAGIVKQHGGVIDLTSEPGRGSAFRIILPAVVAATGPVAAPEVAVPPKGSGQRILLVDDEQAVLTMSKGILEAYNYRVTVARNGLEALALHRRQSRAFDLVITDSMMPGMDGPTLIRYLNHVDPQLKVIAISGLAEAVPPPDGPGAVVITLRKPYEGLQLLTVVAEALAGNRGN